MQGAQRLDDDDESTAAETVCGGGATYSAVVVDGVERGGGGGGDEVENGVARAVREELAGFGERDDCGDVAVVALAGIHVDGGVRDEVGGGGRDGVLDGRWALCTQGLTGGELADGVGWREVVADWVDLHGGCGGEQMHEEQREKEGHREAGHDGWNGVGANGARR